ncbi:hypothetical protein LGM45_30600 [Burkholderia cepacia]|uniref:hypothetical protein n=1 Tax=Burkholderia cepacia TaxID=292 RepID=UPI001CF2D9A7|nr:hypothetical protein [Burkholderia cepacia]MCA7933396.1 hypothetical protein [Burkholderia cepacia]
MTKSIGLPSGVNNATSAVVSVVTFATAVCPLAGSWASAVTSGLTWPDGSVATSAIGCDSPATFNVYAPFDPAWVVAVFPLTSVAVIVALATGLPPATAPETAAF